jgi:hypothetical protein
MTYKNIRLKKIKESSDLTKSHLRAHNRSRASRMLSRCAGTKQSCVRWHQWHLEVAVWLLSKDRIFHFLLWRPTFLPTPSPVHRTITRLSILKSISNWGPTQTWHVEERRTQQFAHRERTTAAFTPWHEETETNSCTLNIVTGCDQSDLRHCWRNKTSAQRNGCTLSVHNLK